MSAGLAVQAYRQVSRQGVSEERLLVLGLDGILEYLRRARSGIVAGDLLLKAPAMSKSYQLVEHLLAALPEDDAPEAGPVSARLGHIYRHLLGRLAQANIFDDLQALDDCVDVVTALRDSWIEGLRQA